MDKELLEALRAMINDDTMEIFRVHVDDIEKRTAEMTERGYRLASASTTGLPKDIFRLTYLKAEYFTDYQTAAASFE